METIGLESEGLKDILRPCLEADRIQKDTK